MTEFSDFRTWAGRLGYNNRQTTEAAELIGMTGQTKVSFTYTGKRDLTVCERLAMSAVRAGLKPWSPEYDDELMAERPAPSTTSD